MPEMCALWLGIGDTHTNPREWSKLIHNMSLTLSYVDDTDLRSTHYYMAHLGCVS